MSWLIDLWVVLAIHVFEHCFPVKQDLRQNLISAFFHPCRSSMNFSPWVLSKSGSPERKAREMWALYTSTDDNRQWWTYLQHLITIILTVKCLTNFGCISLHLWVSFLKFSIVLRCGGMSPPSWLLLLANKIRLSLKRIWLSSFC